MVREDLGKALPARSTIRRHLSKIPFEMGTLHSIIEKLKPKVQAMNEYEKFVGVFVDEAKITPGREYDCGSGSFIGHVTLNPPEETMNEREKEGQNNQDRLAKNAFCIMICGLTTRWKQLVGWHLTDDSFCPKAVHAWLVELISLLQDIGLKVCSLTMDQGGNNVGL